MARGATGRFTSPAAGAFASGGHTLAEMAVVMGVLVVLALFAVAAHLRQTPAYQLDRAATRLVNDLQSARMQSVSESLPVRVSFNGPGRQYTLWADRNTNGLADAGETVVRSWADAPRLQTAFSADQGTFVSTGAFATSNRWWRAVLAMPDADSRYVYVLPSGQVRWTKQAVLP